MVYNSNADKLKIAIFLTHRGVAQLVARLLWADSVKRRLWRMKRAEAGAAVEKTEQSESFFGYRKRADKTGSSSQNFSKLY